MPEGGIELRRDLLKGSQPVLVPTLIHERYADSLLCKAVAWVDGKSFPEFLDGIVEQPDVQIDHSEVLMRLGEVRIQVQRATVLLDRQFVREVSPRTPQEKR